MVTLADSLVSSTARSLPMRVRPDLSALQQRYQGVVYWVIKEPVGLHYFRFQEEEYAILHMLDGQTSLDEIKIEFERRFPPQKITVEELGQFIGMLHKNGLVIASVAGQGDQLRKRRGERKRRELMAAFSNVLALRFKGIDPERLLNWLYPKVSWFYSLPARMVCLALALSALTLVLVQFDNFQNKLPTFHQFFEAKNWVYLTITLALTKVLHEFGHGLTCKHFGGECHEMGVMFLVLTPCLYCNVSDSWMLPNKWHRAWIGAAGMYVELVLASICTFLWWFSEPGMLHQLALSTMFVCSVSTLVFNANPLLRYDGYYILSDLVEIPNLRQKASQILNRKLSIWCLGMDPPEDPFLPQRNQIFFALYTIAAAVYRWVILLGIIWFMYQLFEPYGLKILSQMLAIVSITSLVAMPIYKVGKFFYVPGRTDQVKRKNVYATLAVLTAVALFIVFCPLPYHVMCPLELTLRDADPINVVVPGTLTKIYVKPGDRVEAKQVLGQLRNVELELEVTELEVKVAMAETERDMLQKQSVRDREAREQLPEVEKSLAAYRQQLREKQGDLNSLTLVAHIDGIVLPATSMPDKPAADGDLPRGTGHPLQEKNLGSHLTGVLFCQIGDPAKMDAFIIVDQDDIDFVAPNQDVAIKLDKLPYATYRSKIAEIGPEVKITPRQLSSKSGGGLMSKSDESGAERPISTSYRARAPLDDDSGRLLQGLRGTARISANWQSLGQRLWRDPIRTFNFRL